MGAFGHELRADGGVFGGNAQEDGDGGVQAEGLEDDGVEEGEGFERGGEVEAGVRGGRDEGELARISSRSWSWISGCVERRYAAQVNADEVVSCLGGLALESSLRIKGRARIPRLGR